MPQLSAVSFIGGGHMATAMLRGLAALDPRPHLTVAEPQADKHPALAALGAATTTSNAEAAAAAPVVVLAVKPQVVAAAVSALAPVWRPDQVLVSILAGTPSARLESLLPPGARVVRAMPNTPLAIGQGMVGLCRGVHATAADLDLAEAVFAPCGAVLRLDDEARMDAITAVSGSGPAYLFRTAEALVAAACDRGFNRTEAELLVGRTLAGSIAYLLQQGVAQAAELRRQVTSPGGTTAAAMAKLDAGDFDALWTRALAAAEARGRELGRG